MKQSGYVDAEATINECYCNETRQKGDQCEENENERPISSSHHDIVLAPNVLPSEFDVRGQIRR